MEQLATDLRAAFADMKGLTKDNLFRMRKFFQSCCEIDSWLQSSEVGKSTRVGTPSPQLKSGKPHDHKVEALRRQIRETDVDGLEAASIVGTLSPQFQATVL